MRRHDELPHRDHVRHELIDSDLGALVKARLFVLLEVGFIPVQLAHAPPGLLIFDSPAGLPGL